MITDVCDLRVVDVCHRWREPWPITRNPELLTYKQRPWRIWGMEGLLENVWSHVFLRDGETEAGAGHDVPRIREKKR